MGIRVKYGTFGEILSYTRSSGSSVNPRRQTCAHPHSVWLDAQEKFLYLCDLGTDEILRWPLGETGALITEKRQSLSVPGGYGPRHLVLSPDGKKAWVLTEMIWHLLEVDISGETMVLTRDISYRKKPELRSLAKLIYRKYPAFAKVQADRYLHYNRQVERVLELEREGSVFVIRPSSPPSIGRMEKDPQKVRALYDQGREDALRRMQELQAWLQK